VDSYPVYFTPGMEEMEIQDVVNALRDTEGGLSILGDPFESSPALAEVVYWSSVQSRSALQFRVATVTVSGAGSKMRRWYGPSQRRACTPEQETDPLAVLRSLMAAPMQRALQLGGKIDVSMAEMPVVPMEILIRKVQASGNSMLREDLGQRHFMEMCQVYMECHDLSEARFHSGLALSYYPDFPESWANNLGYLHLVTEDLPMAENLFRKALASDDAPSEKALPHYNLGIVLAQEGDLEGSTEHLRLAAALISQKDEETRRMGCLIQAEYGVEDRTLRFYEVLEPDLLLTAEASLQAIEAHRAST
jgi:hypothetical protein